MPKADEVVGVALGTFRPDLAWKLISKAQKLPVVKVRNLFPLYGFRQRHRPQ